MKVRILSATPIERLEARIAPASVSASIVGTTLKITALSPTVPTDVSLIQISADSFNLIDGSDLPITFTGVRNISAVLSDQSDQFDVTLTQQTYRGSITVNAGDGSFNTVVILGNGATTGDVTVTSTGPLNFNLGADVTVRGTTRVTMANGGGAIIDGDVATTSITGAAFVAFGSNSAAGGPVKVIGRAAGTTLNANGAFLGSLAFTGGAGPDTVNMAGRYDGKVRLALGDGGNAVNMQSQFNPFSAADSVTIIGGVNADQVTMDFQSLNPFTTAISGMVTLTLGDGANTTNVNGNTRFGSAFRVTGGLDADTVAFNGGHQISGATQLALGDGDNGATFTNTGLHGGLRYTGGSGIDAITTSNADFMGTARIALGDGANSATLGATDFDNGLSIKGGISSDVIQLGGSTLRGSSTIALGDGANQVNLSGSTSRGTLSYKGGADSDAVTFASGNTLTGSFNMHGGDGTNLLNIDSLSNLATLSYTGGVSVDTVVIGTGGLFVRGKVRLGDGVDTAEVRAESFMSLSIDGGTNTDTIRRVAAAVTAGLVAVNFETVVDLVPLGP